MQGKQRGSKGGHGGFVGSVFRLPRGLSLFFAWQGNINTIATFRGVWCRLECRNAAFNSPMHGFRATHFLALGRNGHVSIFANAQYLAMRSDRHNKHVHCRGHRRAPRYAGSKPHFAPEAPATCRFEYRINLPSYASESQIPVPNFPLNPSLGFRIIVQ